MDAIFLAGKDFAQRPFDPLDSISKFRCQFLSRRIGSSERNHLYRVAHMMVHKSDHFEFSDDVRPLPSFVDEDQNASTRPDQHIVQCGKV